VPAEPAKPVEPPAPALPPGIPPAGMLSPQQAQTVLDAARAAVGRNDVPAALLLYRRARASGVGEVALLEELRLLRARNRAGEGLGVVAGLSADQRTDKVRIEHGRLLLASNRPREAMDVFTEIRRTAPEAQEALLLIGDSLQAQGQKEQARKVWTAVERGGGEQAKPARDRLAASR
jgi:tetratricopeptide (TPR) repeat protein